MSTAIVDTKELIGSSGHVDIVGLALGAFLVQELKHGVICKRGLEQGAHHQEQCSSQFRGAALGRRRAFTVSTSMAELKNRRERLKAIYQENEKASQRLQAISAALEGASADITEWDESTVYQLLEKVTVLSKDRIRVTFRSGLEIEQNIKED